MRLRAMRGLLIIMLVIVDMYVPSCPTSLFHIPRLSADFLRQIPKAMTHYVENIGTDDVQFIEVLSADHFSGNYIITPVLDGELG
jgi:hypothetical protein